MQKRLLRRDEIETLWSIDRREVHRNIYVVRDGELALTPMFFDVPGWAPGKVDEATPHLYELSDRGGTFRGVFDGTALVGAAATDGVLLEGDRLQLAWLHVSRDYRGRGIGAELFTDAMADGRERGAKYLYISATPTENTIRFYLSRGCELADPPDPALLAAEPDDIHLICAL